MPDEPVTSVDDPIVSVIVVSYNTCEMTLECLRSLRAETSVAHEVIVVDNASDDGSAAAIADEFPDMRLLAMGENLGFALANNVAAQEARGRYVLLLNPDTVVLDRAVDRIVEFALQRPSARVWGGRTRFADGSLNPKSCWRRMDLWCVFCRTAGLDTAFAQSALFNREAYGGWARDSERDVDIVSGCFLLIERDLWNELDGFDTRLVMYGEDSDLCLRAQAAGASPRVTPTAEIVHYGGASEAVRSQKLAKLLQAKISLAKHHQPTWQSIPSVALLRMWPLSRWVAASFLAQIRRTPQADDVRQNWHDVWMGRASWWNGYSDERRPVDVG